MDSVKRKERDILEHSVGFPKMYRNYFIVDPYEDNEDYQIIKKLVEKEMMLKGRNMENGMMVFHVTEKGKMVLSEKKNENK